MKPTDVPQLISELGAGIVEEKLATILSLVASQVIATDKQGEVSLKLKIKKVGATDQVKINHTIPYTQPKTRGDLKETDVQESVMYVNEEGNISQFPEHQMDMIGNGEKQHVN